jgi:protein-glutamine gamma-glutamyltransferase
MNGTLRALLTALVLCNLAFVEMTDAARWTWLGPLIGLTLASPLLVRLQRFFLYRLTWNLAVVGVFAQLVNHTTSAGAQYLLEDGLLLAALCQVHLLNNIGPKQKPDLLLFNSFLVAVVTSFLSIDLGYSVVFLFYAPLLVLSLQVLLASRFVTVSASVMKRVIRDSLPRAAVVLAVTLVAFFLLPRDFQRRGILAGDLDLRAGRQLLSVGFSEEVALDRVGGAAASNRVALRIHLLKGRARDVPNHWRGAVLDCFDGSRWYRENGGRHSLAKLGRITAMVRVDAAGPEKERRFAPLNSRVAGLPENRLLQFGDLLPRRIRSLRRYLDLPRSGRLLPAMHLADRVVGTLPQSASRREIVDRLQGHLVANFEYVPPTESGGARTIAEFVNREAGGHCEIFATTLAVMLRHKGVPCRLATGYLATEWNEDREWLTVREKDAHAWVEVLDPATGWYTVDPTPSSDLTGGEGGSGMFSGLTLLFSRLWSQITGFDADDRKQALASIVALPGGILRFLGAHPFEFVLAAMILGGLGFLRHTRRRRRVAPSVRAYHRAVRRLKLPELPADTPRETLDRARRLAVPTEKLTALKEAVSAHERDRYVLALR